jgi:hypothetical protein
VRRARCVRCVRCRPVPALSPCAPSLRFGRTGRPDGQAIGPRSRLPCAASLPHPSPSCAPLPLPLTRPPPSALPRSHSKLAVVAALETGRRRRPCPPGPASAAPKPLSRLPHLPPSARVRFERTACAARTRAHGAGRRAARRTCTMTHSSTSGNFCSYMRQSFTSAIAACFGPAARGEGLGRVDRHSPEESGSS